jgi:Cu/Ag efflux pump CusA
LKAIFGGWIHCAVRHRRAEWRNPVIADQSAQAQRVPIHDAILQGSVSRLCPVVMTALMAMLGLLPAAVSTSVGSETVKSCNREPAR